MSAIKAICRAVLLDPLVLLMAVLAMAFLAAAVQGAIECHPGAAGALVLAFPGIMVVACAVQDEIVR